MKGNCIEIIGLNYLNIFKNFSIAIENEVFLTISGPNNCGKTTLIRIIDRQIRTNDSITIYNKKQEDYRITELNKIIKTIIPLDISLHQKNVEEELSYEINNEISKEEQKERIKNILKKFKLTKISTKSVDNLSETEIIKLQLAKAFITSPKIILIDDLSLYFSNKELLELTKTIKEFNQEEKITIIMVTSNLESALPSDYIYIINNSNIVIEGEPHKVLEKDNILNKSGLNLPFMMDLSVKLRDYDLIKKVELDMERLVDTLWN